MFLLLTSVGLGVLWFTASDFFQSDFYIIEVMYAMLIALYPTYLRHIKGAGLSWAEEWRAWKSSSAALFLTFSKSAVFVLAAYLAAKYVVEAHLTADSGGVVPITTASAVAVMVVVTVFDVLKSEARGPAN